MTSATRLRLLAATSIVVAATAAAATVIMRSRRTRPIEDAFEVAEREIVAPRSRSGTPDERGQADRYGLDVDRLRTAPGFEPVVQYLTYIQSKRDDESHLLFVRYDDLDAMAEIDGAPTPSFLERLDQLGVVVSNN